MTQKSLIKMQISPIKHQNFEKPSRNPSNRTKVKILKKKNFWISKKKFGFAYAQSPRKCSNIEILAKIEGKEAIFFWKIYDGHIRIWFRSKKNSKLSHACVPLMSQKDWCPQRTGGKEPYDNWENSHQIVIHPGSQRKLLVLKSANSTWL